MKTYKDLVESLLSEIEEIFPWDLEEMLQQESGLMLLDVREADEFDAAHIPGSINVPRGLLEGACDWNYDDTIPDLVNARDRKVVVICRSGNRSVLAAHTMKLMGYLDPVSLKTGVRGWNDYEQPLEDKDGKTVDIDAADELFASRVREDQKGSF
ncbi:MAG: rhodanese-like domain-containing protein [bacterium]